MQGCQWYEGKRIKPIFVGKGNSGQRFGAPCYYLKYSSHFFNKTDLEQYLFKAHIRINCSDSSGSHERLINVFVDFHLT